MSRRFFNRCINERGVTLLELLAVIVLLVLVIGALVSLTTSSYDTYSRTANATAEENDLTLILTRLSSDIRQSVGETPVTVEPSAILVHTQAQDGREIDVRYENRLDGSVRYITENGAEILLAERGHIDVSPSAEGLYQLTVRVGDTQRTSATARYDWGK